MTKLPIIDCDALAALLKVYSLDCIEANPRPFELMVRGPSGLDAELGIYYPAGAFKTYEGACLSAYLIGRPAQVELRRYRVKAGVPAYSPAPVAASTKAEILTMQRALAAREV